MPQPQRIKRSQLFSYTCDPSYCDREHKGYQMWYHEGSDDKGLCRVHVTLPCWKQHPGNKDKVRSDCQTLIERSFRARCIEQDSEERIKKRSLTPGAEATNQGSNKWKTSRKVSEKERPKEHIGRSKKGNSWTKDRLLECEWRKAAIQQIL